MQWACPPSVHRGLLAALTALVLLLHVITRGDGARPLIWKVQWALETRPWFSPTAPVEERVEALLQAMTLEQHFAQLQTVTPPVRELGLPGYQWWTECLHGVVDTQVVPPEGTTMFPMPIAWAAAFDPDMVRRIGATTSDEMAYKTWQAHRLGKGPLLTSCFNPNVNLLRDPRWGRAGETFGEDPWLAGLLGREYVLGLQGSDPNRYRAGATCKHFLAHDLESWYGIDRLSMNAVVDDRDLYHSFLPPFEGCVEAGVMSIMCAYNAVNSIPMCANSRLLNDVLRGEMGWGGHVVTDCGAINFMTSSQNFGGNRKNSSRLVLEAGADLSCRDWTTLEPTQQLEARITEAARRVVTARVKMGHMDPPPSQQPQAPGSEAAMALAREASAKSIVLLKNEGVLPLDAAKLRKIAVIGAHADAPEYLVGEAVYSARPLNGSLRTPLESLRMAMPDVDIQHTVGVLPAAHPADTSHIVMSCNKADLCLFFLGTTGSSRKSVIQANSTGREFQYAPVVEGEWVDRHSLVLPGFQEDAVMAAALRTKTPIVIVLLHNGPLDVSLLHNSPRVGAILTAWAPGNGVDAITDVLLGATSPSGRLPATWYLDSYTRQVPMTDMRLRAYPGRTHMYLQVPVLYPFGYGLSYTSFSYTLPKARQVEGGWEARVTVTNTGAMLSEEVVLLFLLNNARVERAAQQAARRGASSGSADSEWAARGLDHSVLTGGGHTGEGSASDTEVAEPTMARRTLRAAPQPSGGGGPRALALQCDKGAAPPLDDMPMQVLAGFQRLALAPGSSKRVKFKLTAKQWAAFSTQVVRPNSKKATPPCGAYTLRFGPAGSTVTAALQLK